MNALPFVPSHHIHAVSLFLRSGIALCQTLFFPLRLQSGHLLLRWNHHFRWNRSWTTARNLQMWPGKDKMTMKLIVPASKLCTPIMITDYHNITSINERRGRKWALTPYKCNLRELRLILAVLRCNNTSLRLSMANSQADWLSAHTFYRLIEGPRSTPRRGFSCTITESIKQNRQKLALLIFYFEQISRWICWNNKVKFSKIPINTTFPKD